MLGKIKLQEKSYSDCGNTLKENDSYTFDDKEISDILKKTHFGKEASKLDNSHKEAIEKEVDKPLAERPKNCTEQVKLKEVQSVIKDLNSYSAPRPNKIGTLLIKNGSDYLQKTMTSILQGCHQPGKPGKVGELKICLKKSGKSQGIYQENG